MTLKVLKSGSDGNCHILTNNSGKHLIIEAGIPVPDIKKGVDFDIGNIEAVIASHVHSDHSLSCDKLSKMGLNVWRPYLDEEHKNQKTRFGDFEIRCFPLPHSVENRGFIIKVDGQIIAYLCDFEYCPFSLVSQNIDTMIIELNYQNEWLPDEMDEHIKHTILGHASESVTIEILRQNIKSLRNVILVHMSNSGRLNRDLAMKHIREVTPDYISVNYAKSGKTYNLSKIPF